MSWIPRLILALIAGLFGVMMIAIAPPTDKAIFFFGFGVFCLALLYMGVFGIPGATYIYHARFGLRSRRTIEDTKGKDDEP